MKHYSRTHTLMYLAGAYARFVITGRATPFPRQVQIQTDSRCNGHCLFCPYPEVSRRLPQGRMEESLFRKIADEAGAVPWFSEFVFELHNEPLADERTFRFIEYVKTKYPAKACSLVTNGQLIDRFSLDEIKRSKVDLFIISVNAFTPETYEKLSGGLKLEKLQSNIALIMADPDLRRKLQISFVVTEPNRAEVSRAIKYWREKQIEIRTVRLKNRAGVLANFEDLRLTTGMVTTSRGRAAWLNTIKQMKRVAGCYGPFLDADILFDGDVILCCHDWNRTTVLGNVGTSSLREIWNSPKINKIRKFLIQKKYDRIEPCRCCSEVRE